MEGEDRRKSTYETTRKKKKKKTERWKIIGKGCGGRRGQKEEQK